MDCGERNQSPLATRRRYQEAPWHSPQHSGLTPLPNGPFRPIADGRAAPHGCHLSAEQSYAGRVFVLVSAAGEWRDERDPETGGNSLLGCGRL